jgi:hypothetical protein
MSKNYEKYLFAKIIIGEIVIIRGAITMMSKNYEKYLFAKIIIG